MTVLDAAAALTFPGSLLSPDGDAVAPYDLEMSDERPERYRPLSVGTTAINNANAAPFTIDYSRARRIHIINGMGVTLGDSIIGLSALIAIKRKYPQIVFTVYRPGKAPLSLRDLYERAAPLFGSAETLPVKMASLPSSDLHIDMGNHLFWPNFSSMPMIDF